MNVDGVTKFTPSRLTLARERRGMTQRRLSAVVDVSDRMVKGYESGQYAPSHATLAVVAKALEFPVLFFERPPIEKLAVEGASFRALTKASGTLRSRAVAAGSIALEVHAYLSAKFVLPDINVPDLRDIKPAQAAAAVRQLWGRGQKPIPNMVQLLERHGVRVFFLSEDCDAIDAFSLWRDGVPFVFLNTRKTAERSIFDAAHELGHLVLHQHGVPQGHDAEAQADEFATNFLLPEDSFRSSAPRLATISTVASMKKQWRASTLALGRRLHDLGLMTDWHYRKFCIEISRNGKHVEPAPLSREKSAVLAQILDSLSEEGIGMRELSQELHLPIGELRSLFFGLQPLDGGGASSGKPRGRLSLVST